MVERRSYRDDGLPLLGREILKRYWGRRRTGVVEEHIDPAERFGDRAEKRVDRRALRHIGSNRQGSIGRGQRRVPLSWSWRRPARTVRKPASMSASAVCRPIPLPPPVTIAIPLIVRATRVDGDRLPVDVIRLPRCEKDRESADVAGRASAARRNAFADLSATHRIC